MVYKLPIKGLFRLNIVISFLFSALVLVFLLALNDYSVDTILRFLQSLIFMNMVSFGNIILYNWATTVREKGKLSKYCFFLYSYLMALLFWGFVVTLYSFFTGKSWEGHTNSIKPYILAILSVSLFNSIVLIIQNLFISLYRNAQNEVEKLQLKAHLSNTTNLFLRQQIQPHFLFNALTTVKSLYKQDLKLGEEYLIHLANFLRVSVSNPKEHTALIKDEIAFCLNYLKMQKIRFASAIEYDIKISEVTMNKGFIPYFSLQPLIENALKHNQLTEEMPIKIEIYEENSFIVVRNNLQESLYKEESAGNGLYNLSERYRLLDEEVIKIVSEGSYFMVFLKILER